MIIETDRLFLRNMEQSDYGALCKILKDKEVMYAYEHGFSDQEVKEWLDRQLERYRDYGFGLWAVVLKENNGMIGQCGARRNHMTLKGQFIKHYYNMDMPHLIFSVKRGEDKPYHIR